MNRFVRRGALAQVGWLLITVTVWAQAEQDPGPPAAAQKQCAQPPAFDALPRIEAVETRGEAKARCDGKDRDACPQGPCRGFHFPSPAHFPVPQFGAQAGEQFASGALVIYEGMQFVAFTSGRYEVSFTVTIPDIPATVRLQFQVQHRPDPVRDFSITLPPIVLYGATATDGNFRGRTVQVRHIGYSAELHRLAGDLQGLVPDLNISRSGMARFGTLPTAN